MVSIKGLDNENHSRVKLETILTKSLLVLTFSKAFFILYLVLFGYSTFIIQVNADAKNKTTHIPKESS